MNVTPGNLKELAEAQTFDRDKNDAEILLDLERSQQAPLKHLDKDLYPKKRIEAKYERNDVEAHSNGWRKGDRVRIAINNAIGNDSMTGQIEAISADGLFLRVRGHYYATRHAQRP